MCIGRNDGTGWQRVYCNNHIVCRAGFTALCADNVNIICSGKRGFVSGSCCVTNLNIIPEPLVGAAACSSQCNFFTFTDCAGSWCNGARRQGVYGDCCAVGSCGSANTIAQIYRVRTRLCSGVGGRRFSRYDRTIPEPLIRCRCTRNSQYPAVAGTNRLP